MYLFDTSAVIEWLYRKRLSQRIHDPVAVSALTVAELIPAAKEKNQATLDAVNLFLSEVEIIPVMEKTARLAADIKFELRREGKEKGLIDCLIAATAKLQNLTLVSLDQDFQDITRVVKINLDFITD